MTAHETPAELWRRLGRLADAGAITALGVELVDAWPVIKGILARLTAAEKELACYEAAKGGHEFLCIDPNHDDKVDLLARLTAAEAADNLQERTVAWHSRRFPDASAPLVFAKAAEELGEVATAMLAEIGTTSATGKPGDVVAEAADVVIAMLALVGRWWPERDVLREVAKKLEVLSTSGAHPASALALRERPS